MVIMRTIKKQMRPKYFTKLFFIIRMSRFYSVITSYSIHYTKLYDIREPFIMYWPGKIKPGTTCDIPVINEDLYPTFLSVAMAEPEKGYTLDGENIMPLAFGKGVLKRESIFWHFPGYLDNPVIRGRDNDFRTRPTTVIRKGDWKLHLFYEEWMLDGGMDKIATNNSVELYNMKEDIGERVITSYSIHYTKLYEDVRCM